MKNKKMKRMLNLVLMFIIAATFMACSSKIDGQDEKKISGKDNKFGGTIVVAQKMTPPNLDSDKSTSWEISEIMNHVYEGLFEFDANYEPQPYLAKSYEIKDNGKMYIVKLRKGILFHNGKEMTSEDVEASFNRWLGNNQAGSMIAPYFNKLEVIGPYELKFTFKEPYAPFISVLGSYVSNQKFVIRPKEFIEKYGDNIIREHIGTGPYKFVEWIPDQQVVLERFDDYVAREEESSGFAGKRIAYADKIIIKSVSEESTRLAGVQIGEFQFAEEIPQDQYKIINDDSNLTPEIVKPDAGLMLIINCGNPPFNNKKMRRALAYAIDMEEYGRTVIGNEKFWSVDGCLYPKGTVWHEKNSGSGVYNNYDIEKSKELLKEAGYDGTPIVLLNGQDDKVEKYGAIALKAQLEKAGFNVKLELFDRPTVVERRFNKKGWNLNLSIFHQACPDPQVNGSWTGTNGWVSNWDDDDSHAMDEIFVRMMKETDKEKRFEIVKEFYNKTWETLPYIKTFEFSRMHVRNNNLNGYKTYCQPFFWNTWVEKK